MSGPLCSARHPASPISPAVFTVPPCAEANTEGPLVRGIRDPPCSGLWTDRRLGHPGSMKSQQPLFDSPYWQQLEAVGWTLIGAADIDQTAGWVAFGNKAAGQFWAPAWQFWPKRTSESVCPTIVIIGHTIEGIRKGPMKKSFLYGSGANQ